MKKAPNLYKLEDLRDCFGGGWPTCCIDNKWVPARPLGLYSMKNRLRLAWLVFTGKADALKWPLDQ